jgi:hypothetical protein
MATKRMYLVTYDLPPFEIEKHQKVAEAIQAAGSWWHYLASSWILVTEKTPSEVSNLIVPHLRDGKGRLLVIEVKGNYQGWLPEKAWDWIRTWQGRLGESGNE